MHQFDHSQQHPGLFSKYSQHTQSGDAGTDLMATETAWRLWQVMGKSSRTAGRRRMGQNPRPCG